MYVVGPKCWTTYYVTQTAIENFLTNNVWCLFLGLSREELDMIFEQKGQCNEDLRMRKIARYNVLCAFYICVPHWLTSKSQSPQSCHVPIPHMRISGGSWKHQDYKLTVVLIPLPFNCSVFFVCSNVELWDSAYVPAVYINLFTIFYLTFTEVDRCNAFQKIDCEA